jgi:quercetin dioxygenase-like cupin family protein
LALALCFVTAVAIAQNYPNAYPRPTAKAVLSNDRVNVWEVTWPKGQATAVHIHPFDQLSITLYGGTVRITKLGEKPYENVSKLGSVLFTPKGTIHQEEGLNDVPQHKIMLEIKPSTAPPMRVNGVRGAFPREGAVKLLEKDDLIAWDYTWEPGQVVPRHIDDLASVTVFLEDGTIRTVSDKGGTKETPRTFGEVLYSPQSTNAYTEEAVKAPLHAVIVQLK